MLNDKEWYMVLVSGTIEFAQCHILVRREKTFQAFFNTNGSPFFLMDTRENTYPLDGSRFDEMYDRCLVINSMKMGR